MSTRTEWARASELSVTFVRKEDTEFSDDYGSTITDPCALILDNGESLYVIEGSRYELTELAEGIRKSVPDRRVIFTFEYDDAPESLDMSDDDLVSVAAEMLHAQLQEQSLDASSPNVEVL